MWGGGYRGKGGWDAMRGSRCGGGGGVHWGHGSKEG